MNTQVGVLSNRNAIVTGGNRGFGLEIARKFVSAGAAVALCARDAALLDTECSRLVEELPGTRIIWRALDVTSPQDTTNFVAWAVRELGPIDVLVNNAGVYGPIGALEEIDWDKWVNAININLMGSVLMARAVVPGMKQRKRGSIIQISGGGATAPLPRLTSYAASKAGIVRFVESLALELSEFNVLVNAIAPGALNTRLLDEVLEAGPDNVGRDFYERSMRQKQEGGTPLSKGADLAVFLASDAAQGITGRLISAVWDRWEDWPQHLETLAGSDLYTLRRITGRDRGQDWGDR